MLADGLLDQQLSALDQPVVQGVIVVDVRRHKALDALAAAQSRGLAEDGIRPGAEFPQPGGIRLAQVKKPALQQVGEDGVELDLVVELIEIRRVVHLTGQRLVLHGGHIGLAHRAVPVGKAEHVVVQIADAVAHLAPHHVAEDDQSALAALLVDGVDVQLHPRKAQMLQLPEKCSKLSAHKNSSFFNDAGSAAAGRRSAPAHSGSCRTATCWRHTPPRTAAPAVSAASS